MNVKEAFCPECGHRLRLGGHPHLGQRIICAKCETSLTVASLNSVELEPGLSAGRPANQKKKIQHRIEALCPECDHPVTLGAHPRQGDQVICSRCQMPLAVVNTHPPELDVVLAITVKYARQPELNQKGYAARKATKAWK